MKIGLIDVDGHNFPNLALMKLSAYHKSQGNHVEWYDGFSRYDIVYQSRVFDDTYSQDDMRPINADKIIRGGTGYDLNNKLQDSIEHMCPDYNLYPKYNEAYGFLTRGCPRNCPFCIVGKKEGMKSHQVADIDEFYRGQKKIKLLDPNLLACGEAEKLLRNLAKVGAWVDFTQGLDVRLMDQARADLIRAIKIKMIHFAWDNPKEDLADQFQRVKDWLRYDYRRMGVYVLTNFNSSHEEDLYRVYSLRDLGFDPYIMIFDKPHAPAITRQLQRWVNNKRIFRTVESFEEYRKSA